ncbi:hypothetical protein ABIE85_005941 [Bradyrhizobium diazoefficiens]
MLDLALGIDRLVADQRPDLVLKQQQLFARRGFAALGARHRHGDDLADPPGPARQHHDAVGEPRRLFEIVRDIDRAHAAVGEKADEVLHQQLAGLRIQRRERLVHQQDGRPDRQRPRNPDALAHAAGELLWIGLAKIGQAGAAQRILDQRAALRRRELGVQQREFNVLLDRRPGQQRKILEHEGERIETVRRRRPAQLWRAGGRLQQPAEDRQQRALAAAGRTDDRDHLAGADGEGDVVEHGEVAEAVGDVVGDQVHAVSSIRFSVVPG